jgi:Response regulator consisting of a CheY-like receiver domain and a Fis-type HTH domain
LKYKAALTNQKMMKLPFSDETKPSLLLVDDDQIFCQVLGEALSRRGFNVQLAHDVNAALEIARQESPHYAVIDLKLPRRSGLELVTQLNALDNTIRIVILTGYASIATAVEAIKLGATHYLTKPADADDIVAAFQREAGDASAPVADSPMSVDRLQWEHIQKALLESQGNISAAARRLGMHRRTLQRKLQKRPIKH